MANDPESDQPAGEARRGRFRPGKSGNPSGRPRRPKTVGAAVLNALGERVTVKEDGRRKTLTKLEASAKQLANRGASGDPRASKLAFELAQKAEDRMAATPAAPDQLTISDKEIVDRFVARLRLMIKEEDHGPSQPD